MASESGVSVWAGVVQRKDQEEAHLKEQEKRLEEMEAAVNAAQARVEAAQAQHDLVCRQVASKLSDGLSSFPTEDEQLDAGNERLVTVEPKDDDAIYAHEFENSFKEKGHSHNGLNVLKNRSALPDKVASHERWLAARAAESRVLAAKKKSRELLRRQRRDAKIQSAELHRADVGVVEQSSQDFREPCANSAKKSDLGTFEEVRGIEHLDDKPFKDAEALYLRKLDEQNLALAVAELEAAELQLEQMVRQAEAPIGQATCDTMISGDLEPRCWISAQKNTSVEEEHVDRLAVQHESIDRASRGPKNASARSDKEVSRERWLAARGGEERAWEAERKGRHVNRISARDRKLESAGLLVTAF